MKNALIIGASGLVGSYVLDLLIQDKNYSKVVSLVRNKNKTLNPKIEEHVCDFNNLSAYSSLFNAIDELYICTGTTLKKTPDKKNYYAIDFGIPTQAAEIGLLQGIKNIAVISAMGANAKSIIFYNATKGKMEDYLINLKIPHLIIVRPSLIVGPRKERRGGEGFAKFIMNTFSLFIPLKYKAIHAQQIAYTMHFLLQQNVKKIIWENDELFNPEVFSKKQN